MSLRRIVSLTAIAATAALLPALPGNATPSTSGCTPYPPSGAGQSLTIDATPRTVTAGQQVFAFGSFTKGGCPVHGATIVLQRRFLVNGTPSGLWASVASTTTTSHGTYAATTRPFRNEQLRAHFVASNGFHSSWSNTVNLYARTRITEAVSKLSGCRLTISGSTTPHKANRTVKIQKKTSTGQHTVAWVTTNSTGHYSKTKSFSCGVTLHLSAFIAGDSINKAGRSATVSVTPSK
jgi:hypothetical protein